MRHAIFVHQVIRPKYYHLKAAVLNLAALRS